MGNFRGITAAHNAHAYIIYNMAELLPDAFAIPIIIMLLLKLSIICNS